MALTSQHVTGFFVGLGVTAVGFYLYRRNQDQVDEFLRKRGISVPSRSRKDPSAMSLEELVAEKERLEDVIAERETAAKETEKDKAKH